MEAEAKESMPEQAAPQRQVPNQEGGASSDDKAVLERFIYNAMKIASEDGYDSMMQQAKSADSPDQSMARALLLIVNAVKKGLEQKGVEIKGHLYLAKNGILSQVSRIVAALLMKGGVKLTEDAVKNAIEMVAAQLAHSHDMKDQHAEEEERLQYEQEQMARHQQAQAKAGGQPVPQDPSQPQQPMPQDQGMLSQAQMQGAM